MTRILRHIREGFIGVIRHFPLALSSISSVTVTLLIMAVFMLLSANLTQVTQQLEASVQIHVQVNNEFEEESELSRIENAIKAIPEVANVTFSSKDEELEAYIALSDSESAEEMYGSFRGENNPMLHAFIVEAKNGDQIGAIAEEIRLIEGVEKAKYGGDSTAVFVKGMESVRNAGYIIVGALSFIAVFLISNTIRVSIHSRRQEISIMRTVGATNWYIRWPFIIEGMIIGFVGSLLPVIATIFGYNYIIQLTGGNLLSKMLTLVPTMPLVREVSLSLVAIGVIVGALGSLFSVGKQLRWTR